MLQLLLPDLLSQHQRNLINTICYIFGRRQEMEKHKQLLDKEYEQLLTQFSKVSNGIFS